MKYYVDKNQNNKSTSFIFTFKSVVNPAILVKESHGHKKVKP